MSWPCPKMLSNFCTSTSKLGNHLKHLNYFAIIFFAVRLTEVCVGDRKSLQDPFTWIAKRMVTCAGKNKKLF